MMGKIKFRATKFHSQDLDYNKFNSTKKDSQIYQKR